MSKYESIPTVEGTIMVEVISPSTLDEGVQFEAVYEGTQFVVTVPEGGVVEGQSFKVPFSKKGETFAADGAADAPKGAWKDGIFDFLKYGWQHPSFLLACCCPLILTAQVMTRMRMTFLAKPGTPKEISHTFKIMLAILIGYYILRAIFEPSSEYYDDDVFDRRQRRNYDDDDDDNHNRDDFFDGSSVSHRRHNNNPFDPMLYFVHSILGVAFFIYSIYVLMKTREAVRARYEIPKVRGELEDLVCATCCSCCTVSQLARQTANYEESKADFCSDNGLKGEAPVLIV